MGSVWTYQTGAGHGGVYPKNASIKGFAGVPNSGLACRGIHHLTPLASVIEEDTIVDESSLSRGCSCMCRLLDPSHP